MRLSLKDQSIENSDSYAGFWQWDLNAKVHTVSWTSGNVFYDWKWKEFQQWKSNRKWQHKETCQYWHLKCQNSTNALNMFECCFFFLTPCNGQRCSHANIRCVHCPCAPISSQRSIRLESNHPPWKRLQTLPSHLVPAEWLQYSSWIKHPRAERWSSSSQRPALCQVCLHQLSSRFWNLLI